jgi:excisionase family DNA binding protein
MQDSVSTTEAAEILGVSEASVRRWGDAGVLAMQRVGRRRRFRRDDVTAFLEAADHSARGQGSRRVQLAGATVLAGAHLATFYTSDAGRLRIAVPFLRDGLALGEACFLIASGSVRDQYIKALERELGGRLAEATLRGQFVTEIAPGGTVDAAITFWRERVPAAALKAGRTPVRIVGDMACVKNAFATVNEMLTFEQMFTVMSKRLPSVAICQYDVREFDGPSVVEAIKAHPDVFDVGLGKLID